jgi:hypothetical protein
MFALDTGTRRIPGQINTISVSHTGGILVEGLGVIDQFDHCKIRSAYCTATSRAKIKAYIASGPSTAPWPHFLPLLGKKPFEKVSSFAQAF